MTVRGRILQYVMCKLNIHVLTTLIITMFNIRSNQRYQIYAGSNSYRESFFEAMNDITDLK